MSVETPLSPETLARIIDRFGARLDSKPDGSWRFPLRQCKAFASTVRGDKLDESIIIEVVDLSMRGLCFKTYAPIVKGEALLVTLEAPVLPLQTWYCRVIDVHPFDGRDYRVGARFERPSSPQSGSDFDQHRKADQANGGQPPIVQ